MTTTAMVVAATLACAGCKKDGGADQKPAVASPGVTSPAIDALLAAVPGDAMAIGFVDLDTAPWHYITTGGAGFPLDAQTRQTLDKELREYVERYVGVDVSKLQYALGFATFDMPPSGAVLLKTIAGTPTFPGSADYEGAKVWRIDPSEGISMATKGDTVVVGSDTAVRGVLDTMAGKRKAVTVENKPLVDWLKAQTKGAAVAFAASIPPKLVALLPPQFAGLQRVAATVSRAQMRAVVEGDDAAISSLQTFVDQQIATMLAEVERAHADAISGQLPPPEGAFAIVTAAYAKGYATMLRPKREGNRLVSSFDLANAGTESMMLISTIGVLSAVAVPAFMDYMKKSKKSEAAVTLNRMAKNLKVYYMTTEAFPKGDVPLTPSSPCCQRTGGKCEPSPDHWKNPIWQELDFELTEPHLFQYRYRSDGVTVLVEAVGDLDCDGRTVTWRLDLNGNAGQPTMAITEPPPNSD
jgi:hypothetical protein